VIKLIRSSTLQALQEQVATINGRIAERRDEAVQAIRQAETWEATVKQLQGEHTKMAGDLQRIAELAMAMIVASRRKGRTVSKADLDRISGMRLVVSKTGSSYHLSVEAKPKPAAEAPEV